MLQMFPPWDEEDDYVIKVYEGELQFHCRKYDFYYALECSRLIVKSKRHTDEAELSLVQRPFVLSRCSSLTFTFQ